MYSKNQEVEIIRLLEAKAVITKLDQIFARHRIPNNMRSDNEQLFNRQEFKRCKELLGFDWHLRTQMWPQGNTNAESVMKPLGKMLKSASIEKN